MTSGPQRQLNAHRRHLCRARPKLHEDGDRLLGGGEERAEGDGEVAFAISSERIARPLQRRIGPPAYLPDGRGFVWRSAACAAVQQSVEIRAQNADAARADPDGTRFSSPDPVPDRLFG
jgi:hypothetical protein